MTRGALTLVPIALGAAWLSGCGGGSPATDGGGPPVGAITPTSGPYQPLAVGATWTYHVDDQGIVYDKQSSVEALEDIGGAKAGIMGFRVRETIKSSIQLTWYQQMGTEVLRHHDQLMDANGQLASDEWYDPYMLRIDEASDHMQTGASWPLTYTDTKTTSSKPTEMKVHQDVWHVDAVDMPVAVPAGNFAALQVTRTDASDGSTKTQWFVRGVGKIREQTGAGHLEELTAYQIP